MSKFDKFSLEGRLETLVGSVLIRITSVENLLIRKGVFTEPELIEEISLLNDKLLKTMKELSPTFADSLEEVSLKKDADKNKN